MSNSDSRRSFPTTRAIEKAASRVRLAVVVCQATKELYGRAVPALDEKATLRRVALFHRGSGRAHLTQTEKDAALAVIRERFDARTN